MFKQLSLAAISAAFVLGITAPMTLVVTDVEAKGFSSSRSFSRSSFRSPSRSSSKPSRSLFSSKKAAPAKKTTTAPKKYTTNKSKPASSQKFTGKKQTSGYKTVAAGKQTRQAKAALGAQRAKFKKRPTTGTNGYATKSSSVRKKYSRSPIYARAASYPRSTYYSRRNAYYVGYTPPLYAYNAYPSYGMWDTIFLYSMLSNMNNNNARNFAYNHQNDADYQEWRREADRLAQDNNELRAQLAQLDAGTAKMSGPIDPNYIPEGVDADIAMSQEVLAAQKPTLRVCTGSKNGTYFRVTAGVLMQDINSVNIVPVVTSGTGEILENIANGKCDAGFVQGDGYWNYVEDHKTDVLPFERIASPYKEAVHLFCNENGPTELSDLGKNNTVWFPKSSGAAVTWRNFVGENSDYKKVKTGNSASYEESIMKVRNDKNACALYVGAPGASKFVKSIEGAAKQSGIVLVDIDDSDMNDTTDPAGKPVYKFGEIEKLTQLGRQNSCYGYCSGDIETLFVNADFIVANSWKNANKDTYGNFSLDLMNVQPEIDTAVRF